MSQPDYDLFDLAPVAYITVGPTGTILNANQRAVVQLERDRDELIGSEFLPLIMPADRDRWLEHQRECIRTATQQTCAVTLMTGTANPLTVRLASWAGVGPPAAMTIMRTVILDETEHCDLQQSGDASSQREQVFQALRELSDDLQRQIELRTTEAINGASQLEQSKSNFRRVLDAVPDAIILLDAAGVIASANRATDQLFGYVSSELVGKSMVDLVPTFPRLTATTEPGQSVPFETEQKGIKKDGSVIPLNIKTNQIHNDPRFVAIIRDITTRKALEKQVVDSASEEQLRIGQDIHDGMGQELAGLRYMAQTHAESLADGQLNSSGINHARTAFRMSDWLETIQQQMRTIIRQLVPVELDRQGLVAALTGLAERTSKINDVTCTFECKQTCTVSDARLATQLFRIVQEAVNNAVRHSHAKLIKIVLEESGSTLEVRVIDNGVGIGNAPAQSSEHSTTGTGIGLNTMAYRAGLINARLHIGRGDQDGTIVRCSVECDRDFSNR